MIGTLVGFLFFVGLCVRIWRRVGRLNPQAAKAREQAERQSRVAVRRLAEDIPTHGTVRPKPEDPDPPLSLDGRRPE